MMELKTKRLRIIPLNIEQMTLLCEGQSKLEEALGLAQSGAKQDEHLKNAFEEMYQQCCEHPKDYLWFTNWQIILKDENKLIGSIGFRRTANNRQEVKIGYGIDERYRNRGNAAESVKNFVKELFHKMYITYKH